MEVRSKEYQQVHLIKMSDIAGFFEKAEEIAASFKEITKDKAIRIISHLDCDGICAAAIMVKLLSSRNQRYSLSIVPYISEELVSELSSEDYEHYVFLDLGSANIESISQKLEGKEVFIIDHHEFMGEGKENISYLNPMAFGIDGTSEVSCSGAVFFFCLNIDKRIESLSHIALIGAIGDAQENGGFTGLNQRLLEISEKNNKVIAKRAIRLFGQATRPLYHTLKNSNDLKLPGLKGSGDKALKFLSDIKIPIKKDSRMRAYEDLTEKEEKRLASAIIQLRKEEKDPEDIYGEYYILPSEQRGSPLRDLREFATILNACGRMSHSSVGIGACLGDANSKREALNQLSDYKKEITESINWLYSNLESEFVYKDEGYLIINAKDNIPSALIGTIASIISYSERFMEYRVILSLAQCLDTKSTKVSMRATKAIGKELNLYRLIKDIAKGISMQVGGHKNAAGAIIPTLAEEKFIKQAKLVLSRQNMEEKVI